MPRNKRKPATASSCSCCEVSPSPAKQAKPSPMPRTLVSPALQLAHQDIQRQLSRRRLESTACIDTQCQQGMLCPLFTRVRVTNLTMPQPFQKGAHC
ncbi:hypothetical protein DPMN_123797 [Dreissena polymorpha]|uniref:Uncharacterized protein n=1 Tax=Dreissena polymorpha TaxID=45954 RepID=A0A9D4GUF7_DREPO|nr:hypothetical protein DPMN_123797 [Dreissena polymorpha]